MNTLIKITFAAVVTSFVSFNVLGQSWVNVGSSCFSAGPSITPSIAISPAGDPYALYRDDSLSNTANAKVFSGGSWNLVGIDGFSNCVVMWPSLAITSSGIPIAAYFNIPPPYKFGVLVSKFDGSGSGTITDTVEPITVANYLSLALSNENSMYIAYRDDSSTLVGQHLYVNIMALTGSI